MKYVFLIVLAVLGGIATMFVWSPTLLLNTLALGSDVTAESDLPYGSDARHRLDVYRPSKVTKDAPVAVFFYGGSWQWGSKSIYRFVGAALARRGMVAIIADYRVYPPVLYPDFLRDSAWAVRWAKENAARFGGDPAKLFLIGHSAGAYNAAMLTLDRRWLAEVGLDPLRDIVAMVGIAGPYDFLPVTSEALKIIFGPEETRPATQPIMYTDGNAPPMLLLRAEQDSVVDPGNSARLAAKIEVQGGEAVVKTYGGVGHLSIIGTFSPVLSFLAPVLDDVAAFVTKQASRPR